MTLFPKLLASRSSPQIAGVTPSPLGLPLPQDPSHCISQQHTAELVQHMCWWDRSYTKESALCFWSKVSFCGLGWWWSSCLSFSGAGTTDVSYHEQQKEILVKLTQRQSVWCEALGSPPALENKQANKQQIWSFSSPDLPSLIQNACETLEENSQDKKRCLLSAADCGKNRLVLNTVYSRLSWHNCFTKSQIIPEFLNYSLDSRKVKKLNYFKLYKIFSSFPDVCNHPGLMFPTHTMKLTSGRLELLRIWELSYPGVSQVLAGWEAKSNNRLLSRALCLFRYMIMSPCFSTISSRLEIVLKPVSDAILLGWAYIFSSSRTSGCGLALLNLLILTA